MDWRRTTWAATGALVFVTASTMIVTWVAAGTNAPLGHPLTAWPLIVFAVFMVIGMTAFVVAMVKPEWLPDYKLAQREQREAERRQQGARGPIHGFRSLMHHDPNRDLTRALERHTQAIQAQQAGTGGATPLLPPLDYQTDQLRQAVTLIGRSMSEFDFQVLQSVLTNSASTRERRDPIYEPLHPFSCDDGLQTLVDAGEIESLGTPYSFRITPPSLADTSDADPRPGR